MSEFVDHLNPKDHPWMQASGLRRIFDAIAQGGGETRVVGGAVRDALLKRHVGETDLAVNLSPDKVTALLSAAGMKVVPTGIDHGTVTAVANHVGYELTSLRSDVETDGRHAQVVFTDDWQKDATRRDFTFNALYADANGKIYDYLDGRKDLADGRVRFIGDARDRIKEDVLRILRFFRFFAWFGKGAPDAAGLAACRELVPLLPQLSAERVWREIIKLLAAPDPAPSWKLMIENGVLAQVLAEANNVTRLQAVITVETKTETPAMGVVRLAALLPQNRDVAMKVAKQLKLSNREAEHLQMLAVLPERLKGKLDPIPFRRALYEYGATYARDAAMLYATEDRDANIDAALTEASQWKKPVFPLQGNDILKLGISPGPEVGIILRKVEEWWLDNDFRPSREESLAEMARIIG